jgi:hypothetical protein
MPQGLETMFWSLVAQWVVCSFLNQAIGGSLAGLGLAYVVPKWLRAER